MSLDWMVWIQREEGPTGFENSQNGDHEMYAPFEEKCHECLWRHPQVL
jgi:hypothetical protein